MNEVLRDFLDDSARTLDLVSAQLSRLVDAPDDRRIFANLHSLLHAVSGTAGILDLSRLETLALACQPLLANLKNGAPAQPGNVLLVRQVFGSVRDKVAFITAFSREPPGDDLAILAELRAAAALTQDSASAPGTALPGDATPRPRANPQLLVPERREQTLRISSSALEQISSIAADLVATRDLLDLALGQPAQPVSQTALQELTRLARALQDTAQQARMVPFERAVAHIRQLQHDLCHASGRQVALTLAGEATMLERSVAALLRGPLDALVRQAITISIEAPQTRIAAGKPALARLHVEARSLATGLEVCIGDDGCGLDMAALHALGILPAVPASPVGPDPATRAYLRGPACLPDLDSIGFAALGPGFAALHSLVTAMGGTLHCEITPTRGCMVKLYLPHTRPIIPALLVQAGSQSYGLAQSSVIAVRELLPDQEPEFQGLPGFDLHRLLDGDSAAATDGVPRLQLQVRARHTTFSLIADSVAAMPDIVLQPLPDLVLPSPFFAGAALMPDASVLLVLDPDGIARGLGLNTDSHIRFLDATPTPMSRRAPRLLKFTTLCGMLAALPLSCVLRVVHDVPENHVPCGQNTMALLFNSGLLPIVSWDGRPQPAGPLPASACPASLLIIGEQQPLFALAVSEVHGIAEMTDRAEIHVATPALVGFFQHQGEPVGLLDLGYLMRQANIQRLDIVDACTPVPHVLLIEPPGLQRDMLVATLTASGCTVVVAGDIAEALERETAGSKTDCVAVDLTLVEADRPGWNALCKLTSAARDAIGLCAWPTAPLRERAASYQLRKLVGRFDRMALLAALRGTLARQAKERRGEPAAHLRRSMAAA